MLRRNLSSSFLWNHNDIAQLFYLLISWFLHTNARTHGNIGGVFLRLNIGGNYITVTCNLFKDQLILGGGCESCFRGAPPPPPGPRLRVWKVAHQLSVKNCNLVGRTWRECAPAKGWRLNDLKPTQYNTAASAASPESTARDSHESCARHRSTWRSSRESRWAWLERPVWPAHTWIAKNGKISLECEGMFGVDEPDTRFLARTPPTLVDKCHSRELTAFSVDGDLFATF